MILNLLLEFGVMSLLKASLPVILRVSTKLQLYGRPAAYAANVVSDKKKGVKNTDR